MAIALALLVIVVGSVAFHLVTPWWTTPLASNWQRMDDTLAITMIVTGGFFVVINLFVAYTVWRYRHRTGSRAAYEPDNRRLERWLTGITTVGIIGLLAPGLAVYADYVRPPDHSLLLEIVGQQWQWRFRFAGPGGRLGGADARFVSAGNPLGLDPADPVGQDNIVVPDNEVHLPLGRPVKVLLRSHDVLHDFFVPPFRARMNIVPGQISTFWFTPTRPGRYESLCAQLCGVGHPNMRGFVVVEDEAAFRVWLARQTTFAATQVAPGGVAAALVQGRALASPRAVSPATRSTAAPVSGRPGRGCSARPK
jgi:cytochrome c oxidase subunit 2